IRSGGFLVAEARRPGGQSDSGATFVRFRGLELQPIRVIEAESLAHGQIPVGVFEGDVRRGGLLAFVQRKIQHRVQLAAQGFIVGPQRQRVSVFLRGDGVNQLERTVLLVIVKLFQNPGFHLCATVGKGDAVEVVVDDRLGFDRGLPSNSGGGGWSRNRRRRSCRSGLNLRLGWLRRGSGRRT